MASGEQRRERQGRQKPDGSGAHVVRVRAGGRKASRRRVIALYAVLADTPEQAVAVVRGVRRPGDVVEGTGYVLAHEATVRLSLTRPGAVAMLAG